MTALASERPRVGAAARCLALDHAAVTAAQVLRGHGVPNVLLKGPGLASRLYADGPGRRNYSDIDLLVSPADFDRAQQVLRDHGYRDPCAGLRDDEVAWHERPWEVPGPVPLTIDLHRSFAGVDDPMAFFLALASAAEQFPLSGGLVSVPDADCCALVVALHAANPGSGRKAITDLIRAIELLPAHRWNAAAAIARRTGSESAFAEGLGRVGDGAVIAARLGVVFRPTPVQVLRAEHADPAAVSLARLVAIPGIGAKLRHVGRHLAPSPTSMRNRGSLARHGAAGLGMAYVMRLARLLGRAPGGAVQLSRAVTLTRNLQ